MARRAPVAPAPVAASEQQQESPGSAEEEEVDDYMQRGDDDDEELLPSTRPGCFERIVKRVMDWIAPGRDALVEQQATASRRAELEEKKADPRKFDYHVAFNRNIGWVTREEQDLLRTKRVAIGGMGGVGGVYAVTMARLGITKFHLADFDHFEVSNFNRQAGATMSNLGRKKVEVIAEQVRDINPEAEIKIFPKGVQADTIEEFLTGVDCYLDGLDFFAIDARQLTFAACARMKVPAVTVAPLGWGAAMLCFLPGKMTFEEYFQWGNESRTEKSIRFLAGLSPARLQSSYIMDPTTINLAEKFGPSTMAAIQSCAGVLSTQVIKIFLKRGEVICAPRGMQFDPYLNKFCITWRPWGNRNPLQKLFIAIARRMFTAQLEKDMRAAEKMRKQLQSADKKETSSAGSKKKSAGKKQK